MIELRVMGGSSKGKRFVTGMICPVPNNILVSSSAFYAVFLISSKAIRFAL